MAGLILGLALLGTPESGRAVGPTEPAVSGSAFLGAELRGLARPSAIPGAHRAKAAQHEYGFWAYDFASRSYYRTQAQMVHTSDVMDVYLESGRSLSLPALARLVPLFEDQIYPKLRNRLGPEPEPGIDGERAIQVLLLDIRDLYGAGISPHTLVSGYFDPANEYPQADLDARPETAGMRSNEAEMIYLDVVEGDPSGVPFRQTLAHEFAHLIQWNHDPEEDRWLAEGLSELAVFVAGLGHPYAHVEAFTRDPRGGLMDFDGSSRDYGKVYLFLLYLLERAAQAEAQAEAGAPLWPKPLVADRRHGLESLAGSLPAALPLSETFRDYAVAAQLDDPSLLDGRYGFSSLDFGLPADGERSFRRLALDTRASYPLHGLPVTLPPWSFRGDLFLSGRGDVDLILAADRPFCAAAVAVPGAARPPAGASRVLPGCPEGSPALLDWAFPDFRPGGTTPAILSVAANTSATALSVQISALPPLGGLGWSDPLYLPFGLR